MSSVDISRRSLERTYKALQAFGAPIGLILKKLDAAGWRPLLPPHPGLDRAR
jgi:hypothetical protein